MNKTCLCEQKSYVSPTDYHPLESATMSRLCGSTEWSVTGINQ